MVEGQRGKGLVPRHFFYMDSSPWSGCLSSRHHFMEKRVNESVPKTFRRFKRHGVNASLIKITILLTYVHSLYHTYTMHTGFEFTVQTETGHIAHHVEQRHSWKCAHCPAAPVSQRMYVSEFSVDDSLSVINLLFDYQLKLNIHCTVK